MDGREEEKRKERKEEEDRYTQPPESLLTIPGGPVSSYPEGKEGKKKKK